MKRTSFRTLILGLFVFTGLFGAVMIAWAQIYDPYVEPPSPVGWVGLDSDPNGFWYGSGTIYIDAGQTIYLRSTKDSNKTAFSEPETRDWDSDESGDFDCVEAGGESFRFKCEWDFDYVTGQSFQVQETMGLNEIKSHSFSAGTYRLSWRGNDNAANYWDDDSTWPPSWPSAIRIIAGTWTMTLSLDTDKVPQNHSDYATCTAHLELNDTAQSGKTVTFTTKGGAGEFSTDGGSWSSSLNVTTDGSGNAVARVRSTANRAGGVKDLVRATHSPAASEYAAAECGITFWDAIIAAGDSNWLPTKDGTTNFTSTIQPSDITGAFTFALIDVSDEPGYCLNAGTESDSEKDYKFPNQSGFTNPTSPYQTISSSSDANEKTVNVSCLDYGAWGKIKATITIAGKSLDARDSATSGANSVLFLRVPKDDNQNNIGDASSYNSGNAGDDAETDPTGDPNYPGDGFSRYEEYRGFMVGGTHTQLDLTKKDVFVRDGVGYGFGHFTEAKIGLKMRVLNDDEWQQGYRVINYKYETAHNGNQSLVYIGISGDHDTKLGNCLDGPGTPNSAGPIAIYDLHIRELTSPHDDQYTVDPGDGSVFDHVIGHECAHNVNVPHHLDDGNASCIMRRCILSAPNSIYCTDNPNCKSKIRLH